MSASHEVEWETYESLAVFLLDKIGSMLGLERVEGKQKLIGEVGTGWEVDGKGVRVDGGGIVVIECRRHTASKMKQEAVGGFAYRIRDLGAAGGIMVSPLGLQRGARLIAEKEGITEIRLEPDSTRTAYVLRFGGSAVIGAPAAHTKIDVSSTAAAEVIR
ncbi:hypothetical protein [Nocardia beijingensis]|uniref:Restriction endonuclease type IV Mrr domain-containing protein n=1 Tax=Nocardia beijingensis TaxID=95162 RepID=A0ABW7WSW2_9NOCA